MARAVNNLWPRLEDALVTAFGLACAYVFVSSLVLSFLPDAGRGAPSNLLVSAAVFGLAFLVSVLRSVRIEHVAPRRAVERDVTAAVVASRPLADALATPAASRAERTAAGDDAPRLTR